MVQKHNAWNARNKLGQVQESFIYHSKWYFPLFVLSQSISCIISARIAFLHHMTDDQAARAEFQTLVMEEAHNI